MSFSRFVVTNTLILIVLIAIDVIHAGRTYLVEHLVHLQNSLVMYALTMCRLYRLCLIMEMPWLNNRIRDYPCLSILLWMLTL
jgi:hypothetical protein